jgi:hypothetical protein
VVACLMLQRLAASTFLIAGLIALPAEAGAADAIRTSVDTRGTFVPEGLTESAHLRCARGAVALGGAVSQHGTGVIVRRSLPGVEARSWRFSLSGVEGNQDRGANMVLRCVRLRLPDGMSARLEVRTRRRSSIDVPGAGSRALRIGCGPDWLATGYGFTRGARGDVTIAGAIPDAHGWSFVLENPASAPAQSGVSVRCVRQVVEARGQGGSAELRFRAARPEFSDTARAGTNKLAHSCGANRLSLATGSSIDPGSSVELTANGPTQQRGGHWTFRHADAGDRIRTLLVCLDRGSGFH